MSLTLRILLIVVSILASLLVLRKIRKTQMNVADSIFWIFFSLLLVFISIFNNVVVFFTDLFGIESPSNFVFLAIIFVIIIKLFMLSVQVSQLKTRLTSLVQSVAIKEKQLEEKLGEKGIGEKDDESFEK